jgi:hypothetical protein
VIDWSKRKTAAERQAEARASLLAQFQTAIQTHVDATARAKDYHDGNALAGYINSTVSQWAGEAETFIAWRDAVWLHAYSELGKVTGGQRQIPTVETFIAELPAIIWP